jgi:hypothetical protein
VCSLWCVTEHKQLNVGTLFVRCESSLSVQLVNVGKRIAELHHFLCNTRGRCSSHATLMCHSLLLFHWTPLGQWYLRSPTMWCFSENLCMQFTEYWNTFLLGLHSNTIVFIVFVSSIGNAGFVALSWGARRVRISGSLEHQFRKLKSPLLYKSACSALSFIASSILLASLIRPSTQKWWRWRKTKEKYLLFFWSYLFQGSGR